MIEVITILTRYFSNRQRERVTPCAAPAPIIRAGRDSRRSVYPLDDGGDPLADSDAHGCQTVAAAALFHFMDEGRHHARATTAERMPEGYGAAVYVELIHVDAQLPNTGEHLRGKRLV